MGAVSIEPVVDSPLTGVPLTGAPLTASVGILATERLEMDRNGVDVDVDEDGANPDTISNAGKRESRSAVSAVLKIVRNPLLLIPYLSDVLRTMESC